MKKLFFLICAVIAVLMSSCVNNAKELKDEAEKALQHMPVGSVWEVYMPQDLGYGDREQGKIPPFSTKIFKIELLGISNSY